MTDIVALKPNIRYATQKDLECLVAFNAALALETEGKQLAEDRLRLGTRTILENSIHGFYVVAEMPDSPSVIGQLMVTFEWSDWRNAVFWWLQSVYVLPDWRKRGVFRHLYQFVLKEAKEQSDVAGIRLYVEGENLSAQVAYQRLGLSPARYRIFERDFVF